MIDFFMECNPPKTTAQASQRILKNKKTNQTFIGKMSNSKGIATKKELKQLLSNHLITTPYSTPICLSIDWCYPFRKTEKKSVIAKGKHWCTTRPDCDNLNKMFADIMTELGFFADDSFISFLKFKKYYSDTPGIRVKIRELEDSDFDEI